MRGDDVFTRLEHRVVTVGLRIIGITTFLAFFAWSMWHLANMFVV